MKLYNSLTKSKQPLLDTPVTMYSCGPTVYDHVHIGNLSAFIYADSLRRALISTGATVQHVMNVTDVDDKTIAKSQSESRNKDPLAALLEVTSHYTTYFYDDMKSIGNNLEDMQIVKATDHIPQMQKIILELVDSGVAYLADDGVYFSLDAHKKNGHSYGQLVTITAQSTGSSRVNNDEYDKEHIHDFALWKTAKPNEPVWSFLVNGVDVSGRPGWHIECSAMAESALGMPLSIHTGGIDLQFPHHENEIAQSTGSGEHAAMADFFVHNEHLLVDGKKMSKSLGNFYRLSDITDKDFDPLAFRLLMLKSHYRSASNFTWSGLEGAQNQLKNLRSMAVMQYQANDNNSNDQELYATLRKEMDTAVNNDLDVPQALVALSKLESHIAQHGISTHDQAAFADTLQYIDSIFGLKLCELTDIPQEMKDQISALDSARADKDYAIADAIRDSLKSEGLELRSKNNQASEWFYA